MLLSAVFVLVVAQSSSEIPEGLMNNPVSVLVVAQSSSEIPEGLTNNPVFVSVKIKSFMAFLMLKPEAKLVIDDRKW